MRADARAAAGSDAVAQVCRTAALVAAAVDSAVEPAHWNRFDTFVESRTRTVHTLDSVTGTQTITGEETGAHTRLIAPNGAPLSIAVTGPTHHLVDMSLNQLRQIDGSGHHADGSPSPHSAVRRRQPGREPGADLLGVYLTELGRAVDRVRDVVSRVITFSELHRAVACEHSGDSAGDRQVRRRLHLELRTARGGVGEDGVVLAAGDELADPSVIGPFLDRALRRARMAEVRAAAPEGKLSVVFAEATAGVVMHELVGHLLEADIIASGGTALSDRLGHRVCPLPVTVVDDPTLAERWGSFVVDDEGRPALPTPLIEDGQVCGILSDRTRGSLAGAAYVGHNARRATHEHLPLPRMSNLVMSAGTDRLEDVISDLDSAIYCDGLTRGQVDPAAGRFTLSMTSGRIIRSGHLAESLGPAILTGDVLDVLGAIRAVGDDVDDMQTVCGKAGQQVLVEMSAPSVLISAIDVVRA